MVHIYLDAYSGDNAPKAIVEGDLLCDLLVGLVEMGLEISERDLYG